MSFKLTKNKEEKTEMEEKEKFGWEKNKRFCAKTHFAIYMYKTCKIEIKKFIDVYLDDFEISFFLKGFFSKKKLNRFIFLKR